MAQVPGVVCSRCGAIPEAPAAACARCGGANVRFCPACGKQSSLDKKFCDGCGRPFGGPAMPPAAPPPANPNIPVTAVISRSPTGPQPAPGASLPPALPPTVPPARPPGAVAPPGSPHGPAGGPSGALPHAGRGDDAFKQSSAGWEFKHPEAPPPPPPPPKAWAFVRTALSAMLSTLAVAGVVGGLVWFQQSKQPEIGAARVAREYLDALKQRDWEAAYNLFSTEARRACTLTEFAQSRGLTSWEWSGLRIEHKEPGAMLFSYDLKVEGAAPRRDHVLFVQEAGRGWVRPYTWTIMNKVEEAFDKGDADSGLLLARQAALINPLDPMARGYLCEAAYYRKSAEDTVDQCAAALALARIYPSNLSLKSLYHLHAILADTYKNALSKPERALDQYGQMLAFPNISPEDQCEILLARAEAYASMSRPGEALADLDRSGQLCAKPDDQSYIETLRRRIGAPE